MSQIPPLPAINEESYEKKPEFYRTVSSHAYVERTGGGTLLGATMLTVKNIYRGTFDITGQFEEVVTIEHNFGRIYEPIIRAKRKSEEEWRTLPSFHFAGGTLATTVYAEVTEIKENTLKLTFFNGNQLNVFGLCEIEIYAIDFSI